MRQFRDKVAVISGAGSGIGRALACQLAAAGCRVAISDINPETLSATADMIVAASGHVLPHQLDVADRAAQQRFAQHVLDHFDAVDLVINNAGVALGRFPLPTVRPEDFAWIVNVNMWGVIYGTQVFLPHLLKQRDASLVNVASVFGLLGIPGQVPYCTTKFAVRGFTEALRREVRGSGLHVAGVYPGGIKTNIARAARGLPEAEAATQAQMFDTQLARTTADDAARVIIAGIRRRSPRILVGRDARLIDFVARFLPPVAADWLIERAPG